SSASAAWPPCSTSSTICPTASATRALRRSPRGARARSSALQARPAQAEVATQNFEDLSRFRVDAETEDELLRSQTECTFIWRSKAGHPLGVIMSFVHHEGRFWLTASETR